MTDLHLSGPTVTVFGERDALDAALSDELGRRGCSTHSVTIPMGWLSSVTHAVVRLDTNTGASALTALAAVEAPPAHVVAVCVATSDEAESARLDALCRRSSENHDISLIWYPPFEARTLPGGPTPTVSPTDLATTIADEIGHQEAWTSAPSFATQTFEPGRHRAHP